MAAFYAVIDLAGFKRWAFPLVVIGMNSIAMYVLVHTTEEFFGKAVTTHFGKAPFHVLGDAFAPMLHGAAVLLILWLILLWMYRRKLFLRV
jgi:predicted acyltransferase